VPATVGLSPELGLRGREGAGDGGGRRGMGGVRGRLTVAVAQDNNSSAADAEPRAVCRSYRMTKPSEKSFINTSLSNR